MYEQYSRSHSASSSSKNSGSTYDEVPQTITQGLGSPLSSSFNKPDDDDNNNDTGGVQSFLENAWSWLSASGGEPEKPKVYDGSSVYDRSEFDPARYTKPINFSDQDKRINDMLNNRDDDPGYKDDEYAGSTYDEVEDQDIPAKAPVTIKDAINTAIDNTIATGTYTIQKGDTLSEIAAATGKTVIELKQLNDIQNPRKMQAGATLKIPVQTAQDKEVVEGAKSMSDLKPIKLASQSGVPMEDREFFPEDTSDLNNPQTQESMIPTDPMSAQEESFERKGIMSPTPEPVDAITAAKKDLTNKFYDDIGTYGETDHGDTPVQSNDVGASADNLDVGYGHKLKQSEKDSGMIHGIKFKKEDGTYIPLTEVQKREILKKDFEAETNLARTVQNGWDSKLETKGSSWDQLDFKYQNALSSLAFNVGGALAGDDWDRVLDAAIAEDPKAFATEMRRTRDVRQPDGTIKKEKDEAMDNRVAKELYYSGIIDKLSEVSDELPEATARSGVPQ